ncbi:MAG TPA: hypothetical protein PL099_01455 [Thermoclostridium caenicola]|nr:hypothetical protein [Thermoclostridium caenicola]
MKIVARIASQSLTSGTARVGRDIRFIGSSARGQKQNAQEQAQKGLYGFQAYSSLMGLIRICM